MPPKKQPKKKTEIDASTVEKTEQEPDLSFPLLEHKGQREHINVVLLFTRGENEPKNDELINVIKQKIGGNAEGKPVIVHFLTGGIYKKGGLYPTECVRRACFKTNKALTVVEHDYTPLSWYVETPKDPENVVEWNRTEEETLSRMRSVLTADGKTIKPWISNGRLIS